jgi:hypothetical protein
MFIGSFMGQTCLGCLGRKSSVKRDSEKEKEKSYAQSLYDLFHETPFVIDIVDLPHPIITVFLQKPDYLGDTVWAAVAEREGAQEQTLLPPENVVENFPHCFIYQYTTVNRIFKFINKRQDCASILHFLTTTMTQSMIKSMPWVKSK